MLYRNLFLLFFNFLLLFLDKGYYNPQLNLTLPVINGTIPIRTSQILVQYKDPVQLSSGNVSVFIHSNSISTDPIYLRQVYSGQSGHCILSENRKTITIKIFTSTFNQPLTDYFVIIDDNFVKINENGEAVKGIEANVWVFKTSKLNVLNITLNYDKLLLFNNFYLLLRTNRTKYFCR